MAVTVGCGPVASTCHKDGSCPVSVTGSSLSWRRNLSVFVNGKLTFLHISALVKGEVYMEVVVFTNDDKITLPSTEE